MCGISGFFSIKNRINLKRYYDAHLKLAHRGPDDEGFHVSINNENFDCCGYDSISLLKKLTHITDNKEAELVLGHRRLSILDLSSFGHQPYNYKNLSISYNGEIFNYIELREKLKTAGYRFETECDTEVFLKAYHYWGKSCFAKFIGMFAASIFNHETNEICLVRDMFGIKPLYYSKFENNLLFASEMKFFHEFDDIFRIADEKTIFDFLVYRLKDYGENTFFKHINQLNPGNYLVFNGRDFIIEDYGKKLPELEKFKNSEEIRNYVNDSIKIHMRSDVKVGISLSGGLDSSIISSVIATGEDRLNSYSAVYENDSLHDESKYIKTTLKRYGDKINPKFITPDSEKAFFNLNDIIYHMDEPFTYLGLIMHYMIYKRANEDDVRVMLGGQGGDELFGGYDGQLDAAHLELLKNLQFSEFKKYSIDKHGYKKSLSLLVRLFFQKIPYIKSCIRKFQFGFERKILKMKNSSHYEHLKKTKEHDDRLTSFNFGLRQYLNHDDRMAMASSIENRVPFLNTEIFSKIKKYSLWELMEKNITKKFLRNAFSHVLTDEVLNRNDKMGFQCPQELWLTEKEEEIFSEISKSPLFSHDFKEIRKRILSDKSGSRDLLWRYFIISRWYSLIVKDGKA